MMFADESFYWDLKGAWDIDAGHFETKVETQKSHTRIYNYVVPARKGWQLYHFHDTSDTSLVKQRHGINNNLRLQADASKLAAFLYLLKRQSTKHYQKIVKTTQLVAPFFDDFLLRPHLARIFHETSLQSG